MLKLIAVNYTVMLNGYSQWLNIKGEKYFIETSVVLISVMLAFNHKKDAIKEILKIYCLYVVCTLYILRLNVKLLQYKSIFKNFNVRWD